MAREDSPWYPTMRLFRQQTWGDWQELLVRVKDALSAYVATGYARRSTGTVVRPEGGGGESSERQGWFERGLAFKENIMRRSLIALAVGLLLPLGMVHAVTPGSSSSVTPTASPIQTQLIPSAIKR